MPSDVNTHDPPVRSSSSTPNLPFQSGISTTPRRVAARFLSALRAGWYQEEGRPAQSLVPGDIAEIPANVKHWHGAKADCWFSHLAFGFPGEDCSNEWLEPVTEEAYNALEA